MIENTTSFKMISNVLSTSFNSIENLVYSIQIFLYKRFNIDDNEAILVVAIAIADNLRSSMKNRHMAIDILGDRDRR